jgi:hypothetical protein
VIPAKWGPERRAEALAELDRFDAGDLAKKVVSVTFARSDEGAEHLMGELSQMGYSSSLQFDIPWQTLTSWLKESVSAGRMPNLEKIGGQVGQIVTMKEQENG